MKTNASRATLFEVWAAHPVVALLTALLGALTAAAVSYYAFRILAAGDEAPIRVRNGSIEIEVVHRARTWRDPMEALARHAVQRRIPALLRADGPVTLLERDQHAGSRGPGHSERQPTDVD